jgi:hypothetical protein
MVRRIAFATFGPPQNGLTSDRAAGRFIFVIRFHQPNELESGGYRDQTGENRDVKCGSSSG